MKRPKRYTRVAKDSQLRAACNRIAAAAAVVGPLARCIRTVPIGTATLRDEREEVAGEKAVVAYNGTGNAATCGRQCELNTDQNKHEYMLGECGDARMRMQCTRIMLQL